MLRTTILTSMSLLERILKLNHRMTQVHQLKREVTARKTPKISKNINREISLIALQIQHLKSVQAVQESQAEAVVEVEDAVEVTGMVKGEVGTEEEAVVAEVIGMRIIQEVEVDGIKITRKVEIGEHREEVEQALMVIDLIIEAAIVALMETEITIEAAVVVEEHLDKLQVDINMDPVWNIQVRSTQTS
jgi:hypothetical protein